MQDIHVYQRKTFKYNDGWSHLDDWDFLATVRLTAPRRTEEGNGYDQGGSYVQYARVPAGQNWRRLARALQQTLQGSGCQHEYDCCGCANHYVKVRLIAPRRLLVRTSVTYNY